MSAQAYELPVNMTGLRGRVGAPIDRNEKVEKAVRKHLRQTGKRFQENLLSQSCSDSFWRIQSQALTNPRSKVAFLAWFLQQPAVPLHVALEWINLPIYRSAFASFVSGDWGLCQYSANDFAKSLLPRSEN